VGELFPPLPPEYVAHAESGVSILIGTCSADLDPDCVRGVGVRVWPDACHLTVLVPVATSVDALANLAGNPRLAVTMNHVPTHHTIQVKGRVLAIRAGADADLALATVYRERFARDLARVGMPAANTLRLGIWPCMAIDLAIDVCFAQTPGPKAGEKMPLPELR
jgi:hypothetical protein